MTQPNGPNRPIGCWFHLFSTEWIHDLASLLCARRSLELCAEHVRPQPVRTGTGHKHLTEPNHRITNTEHFTFVISCFVISIASVTAAHALEHEVLRTGTGFKQILFVVSAHFFRLLSEIVRRCMSTANEKRSAFQIPDVFVAIAIKNDWFPPNLIRELIQLISAYVCRFGSWQFLSLACSLFSSVADHRACTPRYV